MGCNYSTGSDKSAGEVMLLYFLPMSELMLVKERPVASFAKEVHPRLVKRPLKTNGRSANLELTHWGRVTHICVGNLTIIGSDNGLSPDRRQAITWTNVGISLIGPLGTNFSEMLIEMHVFSFKKIHWKMAAILSRPQCVNFLSKRGHRL